MPFSHDGNMMLLADYKSVESRFMKPYLKGELEEYHASTCRRYLFDGIKGIKYLIKRHSEVCHKYPHLLVQLQRSRDQLKNCTTVKMAS